MSIEYSYRVFREAIFATFCSTGRYELSFLPKLSYEEIKAIQLSLDSLSEYKNYGNKIVDILKMRYGLNNGHPKSLQELSDKYGVTRSRIQQQESKGLRMMRHPSRSRRMRPTNNLKLRIAFARHDLYVNLKAYYPEKVAFIVAKRVKDDDLREAFKSLEIALKSSCGIKIDYCQYCHKPLPPGWQFCDIHCRAKWKIITVECARCGKIFERHQSVVVSCGKSYCSIECRNLRGHN